MHRRLLSLSLAALALACATPPRAGSAPTPADTGGTIAHSEPPGAETTAAPVPPATAAETRAAPAPSAAEASAASAEPRTAATDRVRVQRPAYSFPIPSGWQEIVHPSVAELNAAGGAIISRPAASEGWFSPTVVIAPVPPGALPTAGIEDCRAIAAAVAELTKTRVDDAHMLNLPSTGRSCQFDLTSSANQNRRGRGTVLVGESPWTATCNYDARDAEALPACDAVVEGFRFAGTTT